MRPDFDLDHQVTWLGSDSNMAFLRHSEVDSVVNSFGDVDCFCNVLVGQSFSTAGAAGVSDNLSLAIAIAAHLLNHERTLPYSLKSCTSASSALRLACAWFRLASLASSTEVCSPELDSLLSAIDGIHEVYFNTQMDVFASARSTLTSSRPLRTLSSAEELLEFIKYVSERRSSLSSLPKLVLEAFET